MNNTFGNVWSGFSASIIGSGHIKRGLPCQDASATVVTPRPALIVCDGRGSASRSQDGANGAVRDFITQCAVFEPMLASILDADDADAGRWEQFGRIIYRTLMQTKLNLSAKHGVSEKEFDFTVAAAVVGTRWIGCFQVGDGSIVLRQNGTSETVFLPDKGEFANQTYFLRENGEVRGKFHAKLFSARENSGIAITSDGPEHLMFHLAAMTPGRIFDMLFDDMQNRTLTRQDIMDYLTRREWDNDPRGQDDRSIAILAPTAVSESARGQSDDEQADARTPGQEESAPFPTDACARPEHVASAAQDERKPFVAEPVSPVLSTSPEQVHTSEDCNPATAPAVPVSPAVCRGGTDRTISVVGIIAGSAIVIMLLSLVHFHAEVKTIRKELNTISTRRAEASEPARLSLPAGNPDTADSDVPVVRQVVQIADARFVDESGVDDLALGDDFNTVFFFYADEYGNAGEADEHNGGFRRSDEENDLTDRFQTVVDAFRRSPDGEFDDAMKGGKDL